MQVAARVQSTGPLGHEGVDLALPARTAVRAVHEGTVLWAGDAAGYGLGVLLEHERQSLYAHLAEVHVRAGESVGTRRNRLG